MNHDEILKLFQIADHARGHPTLKALFDRVMHELHMHQADLEPIVVPIPAPEAKPADATVQRRT